MSVMDSSFARLDDTGGRSEEHLSRVPSPSPRRTIVFTDRNQERASQVEPNAKHELPRSTSSAACNWIREWATPAYPGRSCELLQRLRCTALKAIVLGEVVDVTWEVHRLVARGAHVSFQSLAGPSVVEGDGKDDLPPGELNVDHRVRECVLHVYQEMEDFGLRDDRGIEMALGRSSGLAGQEGGRGPWRGRTLPWLTGCTAQRTIYRIPCAFVLLSRVRGRVRAG